jgi:uncharacterized protein with GYD domain
VKINELVFTLGRYDVVAIIKAPNEEAMRAHVKNIRGKKKT